MSWIEVSELVRLAQTGDRSAFGELVTRFEGAVFAAALSRMRDYVEAEELTQEVFVHAMRKLPQLRDPRCFAGWLRRITARMAINRLTRRGMRAGLEPEVIDAVAARTAGPAEEAERTEERAALRAGLRRLKAGDRATLEAFYLRGQSLKQMARTTGAPLGTIKRRLHVARQRLKDALVCN